MSDQSKREFTRLFKRRAKIIRRKKKYWKRYKIKTKTKHKHKHKHKGLRKIFLRKLFKPNWDFLINYISERFFFNHHIDTKYLSIFLLLFKDFGTLNPFLRSNGKSSRKRANAFRQRYILNLIELHKGISPKSFTDTSLEPILLRIVPFDNIKINFFSINNDHITALFLARYFALKVGVGHGFRATVSPVAKDLTRVIRMTLYPFRKSHALDRERMFKFFAYRNSFLKICLSRIFSLSKNFSLKGFHFFSNFLLPSSLRFFIFLRKFSLEESMLLGLSKIFFLRKHIYNFFFVYETAAFIGRIFKFFASVSLKFNYNNLVNLPNTMNDLFVYSTTIFIEKGSFGIEPSSLKIASFFFNQIITHNYWFFNMHWLYQANGLNKSRARAEIKVEPFRSLLFGFKFHFRGRFSRKQRAGSMLVIRGNMPLTTISNTVDYAFLTVPLDNSLVSIKVWLFKSRWAFDLHMDNMAFIKLIRLFAHMLIWLNRRRNY